MKTPNRLKIVEYMIDSWNDPVKKAKEIMNIYQLDFEKAELELKESQSNLGWIKEKVRLLEREIPYG